VTSLPVSRKDRDWLPSMRRMKHKAFSLLVLLALLLGLAACSGKATPIPSPTDSMQTFEQEVERLRKELKIPGMSVAVMQEQEVIFARGFGYADLENRIPATEDTPYNIASCTKPFAAVVLMQLVSSSQGPQPLQCIYFGFAPGT
jgi:CubicO group peptidase (beta-lactamase class C family)